MENKTNIDYSRGIDNVSVLKDISPPRATEPSIVTTESIVEALKVQTNVYKERLVTSSYRDRKIKQVRRNFWLC